MVNPFVERLYSGEWSPARFRRHLKVAGAPLIERVSAGGEVEVTFADEPGEGTTKVELSAVIGHFIGRNTVGAEVTLVAGTPFHTLTLRMRSDLRFSYAFALHGRAGEIEEVPDPFNPPRGSRTTVLK